MIDMVFWLVTYTLGGHLYTLDSLCMNGNCDGNAAVVVADSCEGFRQVTYKEQVTLYCCPRGVKQPGKPKSVVIHSTSSLKCK